jgi:hypothetical protein
LNVLEDVDRVGGVAGAAGHLHLEPLGGVVHAAADVVDRVGEGFRVALLDEQRRHQQGRGPVLREDRRPGGARCVGPVAVQRGAILGDRGAVGGREPALARVDGDGVGLLAGLVLEPSSSSRTFVDSASPGRKLVDSFCWASSNLLPGLAAATKITTHAARTIHLPTRPAGRAPSLLRRSSTGHPYQARARPLRAIRESGRNAARSKHRPRAPPAAESSPTSRGRMHGTLGDPRPALAGAVQLKQRVALALDLVALGAIRRPRVAVRAEAVHRPSGRPPARARECPLSARLCPGVE